MPAPGLNDNRLQVKRVLLVALAVNISMTVLKLVLGLLTGSLAVLADAMHSATDGFSSLLGLLTNGLSDPEPDRDHPYGHHKAEYFSSGFEGVLIMVAALAIVWAATHRLLDPQPLADVGLGLALSVASSVLNGVLAFAMLRKAREHRSMALEADARHLITDVWTSAGVVVGLLAVKFTGWLWLDPAVAILLALNILREGGSLVRRSADGLMDRALEPEVRAEIEKTLDVFRHQAIRFDHVTTRRAGQRRFVDLHMHMPAAWTLGRAAALRTSVEQALMSAVPGLRATIQLLPMDVEAHFDDAKDLI